MRIIIALLIVVLVVPNPRIAHAEPATLAIISGAALGSLVIGYAGYRLYKPTAPVPAPKLSPNTQIGRSLMLATWLQAQNQASQLWGKMVAAKVSLQSAINEAISNPALYPNFYNAVTTTPPDASLSGIVNNSSFTYGGKNYTAGVWIQTGSNINSSGQCPGSYPTINASGILERITQWSACSGSNANKWELPVTYVAPAPKIPRTVAQAQPIVSDPASGSVNAPYLDELDAMIAAFAGRGTLSIVDTATPGNDLDTAPPLVPPAGGLGNPPADYVPPVSGLGSQAAQNAANNSSAANAARDTAQAARDSARSTYDASPTEANKAALDAAESALRAANDAAAAAANTASNAKQATEEQMPGIGDTALKTLNFEAIKSLIGVMSNKWPITLLQSVTSLYTSIVTTPQAPVFSFYIPYASEPLVVDLAPWDTFASIIRWMFAALLTVGCLFMIVRFYRGVS